MSIVIGIFLFISLLSNNINHKILSNYIIACLIGLLLIEKKFIILPVIYFLSFILLNIILKLRISKDSILLKSKNKYINIIAAIIMTLMVGLFTIYIWKGNSESEIITKTTNIKNIYMILSLLILNLMISYRFKK